MFIPRYNIFKPVQLLSKNRGKLGEKTRNKENDTKFPFSYML